jgi:hypothetical protein
MDVPLETSAAARSCSKSDDSNIPDSSDCLNPFQQLESRQNGTISTVLLLTSGILDKSCCSLIAASPLAGSNAVIQFVEAARRFEESVVRHAAELSFHRLPRTTT